MKKYHIKNFILYLIIAGLCWSCTKDEDDLFDPYTGSYEDKLHKMVIYNASYSDSSVAEFKYDSNGKVASYYSKGDGSSYPVSWTFLRNDNGQIIGFINEQTAKVKYYCNYNIGSDGKYVSGEHEIDDNGEIINKITEIYKYDKNLITQIYYSFDSNTANRSFSYDKNGSIIKIVENDSYGEQKEIFECTYDTKINPVELFEMPYYFGNAYFFPNSQNNNMITSRYNDQNGNVFNASYSYIYNKSGKPASSTIIINRTNGPKIIYNLKYIYYNIDTL